jgi:hypothetical protein
MSKSSSRDFTQKQIIGARPFLQMVHNAPCAVAQGTRSGHFFFMRRLFTYGKSYCIYYSLFLTNYVEKVMLHNQLNNMLHARKGSVANTLI